MNVARVDRVYVDLQVTGALRDGTPAILTGVDVALLAPRTSPTAATTWTTADYADGTATVLLAGPDADPSAALVVPAAGCDLWIRITDSPEILTANVERITVS